MNIGHDVHWSLDYLDERYSDALGGNKDVSTNRRQSAYDLNEHSGTEINTFTLPSYQFDEAGHVVERLETTYTLPRSYSYTGVKGKSTSVVTTESTLSTLNNDGSYYETSANVSKDRINYESGNRWIYIKSSESANEKQDIITLSHSAPEQASTYALAKYGQLAALTKETNISSPKDPINASEDVSVLNAQYYDDSGVTNTDSFKTIYISRDEAGHVNELKERIVVFPKPNAINWALTDYANTTVYPMASIVDTRATGAYDGYINGNYTANPVGITATDNIKQALNKLEDKVNLLNGNDTVHGSVVWQINNLISSSDVNLDTLKEIADWISTNKADVDNYKTLSTLEDDFYGLNSDGTTKDYEDWYKLATSYTPNTVYYIKNGNDYQKVTNVTPGNFEQNTYYTLMSANDSLTYLRDVANLVVDDLGTSTQYERATAYQEGKTYYYFDTASGEYVEASGINNTNFYSGTYYTKEKIVSPDPNGTLYDRINSLEGYTGDLASIHDEVQQLAAEAAHAQQTLQNVRVNAGNNYNSTDGYMHYHIGADAPVYPNTMWIDTSNPNNVLVKFTSKELATDSPTYVYVHADDYVAGTQYYTYDEATGNYTAATVTSQAELDEGIYFEHIIHSQSYKWYAINTWQ